jgi:hypothetical protein
VRVSSQPILFSKKREREEKGANGFSRIQEKGEKKKRKQAEILQPSLPR